MRCHNGGPRATWQHESPSLWGGGVRVLPQAWHHMAAREPASVGRQTRGATTDTEQCGSTGARLCRETNSRCHHGHRAMWQHGSPPLRRGGAEVPPQAQSHVLSWEPFSTERRSRGVTMSCSMVKMMKLS
jgi:hypothetical protein